MNLIDFVFLIKIIKIWSCWRVKLTDVWQLLPTYIDACTDTAQGQSKAMIWSLGIILFIFVIYTLIHLGKVSLRWKWKYVWGGFYFTNHIVTVIIVKTYKTVLNLRYLFYMLGNYTDFGLTNLSLSNMTILFLFLEICQLIMLLKSSILDFCRKKSGN